jgi:hypothetical protein
MILAKPADIKVDFILAKSFIEKVFDQKIEKIVTHVKLMFYKMAR